MHGPTQPQKGHIDALLPVTHSKVQTNPRSAVHTQKKTPPLPPHSFIHSTQHHALYITITPHTHQSSRRAALEALAAQTAGQLQISREQGHTTGVQRAQVGVGQQPHDVRLGGLLQRHHRR